MKLTMIMMAMLMGLSASAAEKYGKFCGDLYFADHPEKQVFTVSDEGANPTFTHADVNNKILGMVNRVARLQEPLCIKGRIYKMPTSSGFNIWNYSCIDGVYGAHEHRNKLLAANSGELRCR